VVFAHAKNVEADAVSGLNALEEVLNGLYGLFVLARGEAVDSEFHGAKVAGMQLPTLQLGNLWTRAYLRSYGYISRLFIEHFYGFIVGRERTDMEGFKANKRPARLGAATLGAAMDGDISD
jgi:hypothetical protein